jgi:hypothetical protein
MPAMKHAGSEALDRLEELLAAIRRLGVLQERPRGSFYRKSKAVLHFHEDPAGLFADLRTSAEFERFPVTGKAAQVALLKRLKDHFSA